MEKFIVSARKYRPQTFDTVVGQSHITTTLKNAIRNNQLAHAFLFCGPRGVGKTTCARILAKTINCENRHSDGEACNECRSCISFNEGTSLNIHELDAASNNSVDDIRSLVDQVRFAPQAGEYKVYIIDEVHMLSSSAFNAFLKTLEEPPPYAIFILATTEKHKILPTILSRCQIFDFKRITIEDTVEHLQEIAVKEEIQTERAALQLIAQKSEGCMRDALSILDKIVSFTNGEVNYQRTLEHLNILDADYYFRMIESMMHQDLAQVMLLFDDILQKGFEEELILTDFAEFLRNLLLSKDERIASLLQVVESFKARYLSTAKKLSTGYLVSALNILNESEINYKAARNKRLHVELALIRLTYLLQALELSGNGEGFNQTKAAETARPVAFRQIPAIQPFTKGKPGSAKLIIDDAGTGSTGLKKTRSEKPDTVISPPVADPVVPKGTNPSIENRKTPAIAPATENILPAEKSVRKTEVESKTTNETRRPASLEEIRKQVAGRSKANALQLIPLEPGPLTEAWKLFTETLKSNNNPAAQSFNLAELKILSEGNFEVITNNNLEQKFIEQEKRLLSEFLQEKFRNKLLHFTVVVSENPVHTEAGERPLSRKEQFAAIVDQYPLVKELKDRL
ncbi:MAG TPA: DNA polymerase III subunit gamma/tau, partial [Flavitalea sp.]|nr:DNA polymerase III subunit gamma/tau [Flavitalea sp.]